MQLRKERMDRSKLNTTTKDELEKEKLKNNTVDNEKCYVEISPVYPNDERYEDVEISPRKYSIPTNRPVRIYCDGIFDLFHYGHSRLFEQVKNLFPNVEVVVGVCNDELTTSFKGSVVMNEQERYEGVRQCRFVDEVIEDAPWVLDMEFLNKHRIDFVAHDEAPYPHNTSSNRNNNTSTKTSNNTSTNTSNNTSNNMSTNSNNKTSSNMIVYMENVYELVKKNGLFIPTKRARKISTTGLITRLIKNYDYFLKRQLLRGIHYKDLNISFMKKKQIKFKEDVNLMKEEIRTILCYWEDLSKEIIQKIKNKFIRDDSNLSLFQKAFNR